MDISAILKALGTAKQGGALGAPSTFVKPAQDFTQIDRALEQISQDRGNVKVGSTRHKSLTSKLNRLYAQRDVLSQQQRQDQGAINKAQDEETALQGGMQNLAGLFGGGGGGGGTASGFDMGNATGTAMLAGRAMTGDPMAIAKLAKKSITDRIESFQEMGQHLGSLAKQEKLGGIASQGAQAAFSGIDAALGPVKDLMPLYQMFKQITVVGLEAIDKLQSFAEGLHKSNMEFAKFSGGMASVQARQEVRDIMLSQERGDRRADSAERLAQAMNRLDKAKAPLEDEFANLKAELLAPLLEFVSRHVDMMTRTINFIEGMAEVIDGQLAPILPFWAKLLWADLKKKQEDEIDISSWFNEASYEAYRRK